MIKRVNTRKRKTPNRVGGSGTRWGVGGGRNNEGKTKREKEAKEGEWEKWKYRKRDSARDRNGRKSGEMIQRRTEIERSLGQRGVEGSSERGYERREGESGSTRKGTNVSELRVTNHEETAGT